MDEDLYIQLYSPECTLAENIDINNNKQNKDRNILINTVQLNIRYTFVNVLTKDITEDALCKFPHEFRTPRNAAPAVPIDRQPVGSKPAACMSLPQSTDGTDGRTDGQTPDRYIDAYCMICVNNVQMLAGRKINLRLCY